MSSHEEQPSGGGVGIALAFIAILTAVVGMVYLGIQNVATTTANEIEALERAVQKVDERVGTVDGRLSGQIQGIDTREREAHETVAAHGEAISELKRRTQVLEDRERNR